jgi:hypothetical protein
LRDPDTQGVITGFDPHTMHRQLADAHAFSQLASQEERSVGQAEAE